MSTYEMQGTSNLNEKEFKIPKGIEILMRQILKMLNLDPQLMIAQINGIHSLMSRHVSQQEEMLAILQRLESNSNVRQSPLSDRKPDD